MPIYKAPVDDVLFLLNDVFHLDRYDNLPGFSDASPDVVEAILGEAAKFTEEVLTPLNRVGDLEGCTRHDDGSVTTPTGFKDAYQANRRGRLDRHLGAGRIRRPGPAGDHDRRSSTNSCAPPTMAFAMYPGLTQGAIAALLAHGADEQKEKYLPKMVDRRMDRHHEPDRAALRHRSRPAAHQGGAAGDGSYKITGTKIFISAGEHDLAENIIHLVLARIEGAPAGTKGISLFVVPKFLVNDDGSLGARNGVTCGSIEEKMGIHGNSTCVMNYDDATGWLVGEENRGPQRHVHDDERGAARRRRAGPRAVGSRLSERRALRQGAPAGPRALRRQISRQGRRSDHRASGRAPHADDDPRLQRSGARAGAVDRAQGRRRASLRGRQGTPERRRPHGSADAGDQRRAHRRRLCQHRAGAAGVRRPRLHRRARHGAVRARRAHRHDLRRRQRHPGARSRRPQARQGWRPRDDGVLQRGRRLHQGERAPTRA